MDANPELDAAVLWQAGIALDHAVLDLDRAANSVHDAAEFDDRSIARALDDTTVMYSNCGIDQIATQGSQPRENSVLVGPGKAAVTDHIGNKDRGKLARFLHHKLPPESIIIPMVNALTFHPDHSMAADQNKPQCGAFQLRQGQLM